MPPEPFTLAFDTSAAHCAVALLSGDTVLAERVEEMTKGQAERLFVLIEELMGEVGIAWSDLACIGVGIGPGNFTGVRISVSAARGLALSLGVPAIGVSSLEAQAEGTRGVVVSVLNARKESYYVQIFGDGRQQPPAYCDIATLPTMPARAEPSVIGFHAGTIANLCAGNVAEPVYPIAVAIAQIAKRRIHSANTRPAPLYLRAADAAPPREAPPVILP